MLKLVSFKIITIIAFLVTGFTVAHGQTPIPTGPPMGPVYNLQGSAEYANTLANNAKLSTAVQEYFLQWIDPQVAAKYQQAIAILPTPSSPNARNVISVFNRALANLNSAREYLCQGNEEWSQANEFYQVACSAYSGGDYQTALNNANQAYDLFSGDVIYSAASSFSLAAGAYSIASTGFDEAIALATAAPPAIIIVPPSTTPLTNPGF